MVDHDVFFCGDALDYVAFAEALLGPGHLPVPRLARAALFYVPPHQPWRWRLNDAQTLWKMLHTPVHNPLRLQYWSQTPYALGPHAIKFTARPVGAELAPGPEPP